MDSTKKNAIALKLLQVLAEEKLSYCEAVVAVSFTYNALEHIKENQTFTISENMTEFESLLSR